MTTLEPKSYPGFPHSPDKLFKFIAAGPMFTIQLTSGSIIHFEPEDPDLFKEWLLEHNVQDIK